MGVWRGGRRPVRILLAGDPGVGKTSLILSLVSEEFPEDVPSRAEEITIPADVTPEEVPTNIVDYNAVDQSEETLEYEIQRCHVVCLVYSVDDEDSLDRVTSHWLPLVREYNSHELRKPVVLVGNKVDLVDYSTIDHVLSIMEDFPEVESCVECSAKTLKNISEMFYYAQKAVLHPTSPLYVMENQDLTEGCKQALIRIFKVCDIDGDGLLNDYEMNHFQRRCFNAPLQPQVLDEVKAVLQHNVPNGIEEDSVTLKGFLFLHVLFIQRGRNETTWAVLRKFGYNENLEISKEYLCPPLKVPSGSTTELSHRGQQFLCHIFERNDRDQDGALSPHELKALFSACPRIPWTGDISRTVPTNEMGWLTLHGWLCQWSLMTLINVQHSLEYLAYLGFNIHENDSQLAAIQVTREKRLDLAKKQSSRNVYVCHVIGPNGSGKSAFCQNFIKDDPQLLNTPSHASEHQYCINTVQVYGQEKYLVLRDIEVRQIIDPLLPNEVNCDVACLLYDSCNPKSFEYVARIYIKYFAQSNIPVLVVATKSDLEEIRQDYILQPAEFCDKYKILPPQQFTMKFQYRDVYVKLATMAAFPRFQAAWILFYKHRFVQLCQQATHLKYFGLLPNEPLIWWKAGLGIAAATAFGYLVLKVFSGSKTR